MAVEVESLWSKVIRAGLELQKRQGQGGGRGKGKGQGSENNGTEVPASISLYCCLHSRT